MEDLIANGIRNRARKADEMLQNEEGDDDDHEPVEEDDEANGDEDAVVNCGNNNDRNISHRTFLNPLNINILTNISLSRTTHISVSHLMYDTKLIQHKS